MGTSKVLSAALRNAKNGKPIFPCGADKKPLTKHGFHDATTDPKQIRAWWSKYPNAMIGMPTGQASNLDAVDVDVDPTRGTDGNNALFELERKHSKLPDTPETLTPRGGRHILFKHHPGIRNSAGKLGDGIDVRGDGGYIILPPSGTNGHQYQWEASNPKDVAEMPAWLAAEILKTQGTTQGPPSNGADNSISEGNRNAHLASLAGSMRRRGMSADAMEAALLAENAGRCNPPLPDDEIRKIATSVGRYKPALYPQTALAGDINNTDATTDSTSTTPPTASAPTNWRTFLLYKDEEGNLRSKSQNNACVLLTWHDDMRGLFAFDSFAQEVDITRKPPWGTHVPDEYPRHLRDADITLTTAWLEHQGIYVSNASTHSAIVVSAQHHTHDPLRDYVNSLVWDGKPRLLGWIPRLLGAASTTYNEMVGRLFLIGAIARALNPGCQMDTMMVLEGLQGILKSSTIRVLFSPDWFTDELHSIGSKDAAMELQGHWAVEVAEMHAMTKAEANQIKEWITRRVDKFRPPYGKCVIESPRRCVLIGTLNPEGGYLKDPTGGRRFWPVKCNKIDLAGIRDERDQLFAEAASAYHRGERWWMDEAGEELARIEQEERYETDPWSEIIDSYVENRDNFSTADILEYALTLSSKDWTKQAEMRVGRHLTSTGWSRKRVRANGNRRWVYSRNI